MVAYVIFLRETPVHDPAEMQEYLRKGQAAPPEPKLTPLAVYGPQIPLEGKAPDGVAVLQFPTVEDAKTWYYGDYEARAQHRRRSAEYRAVIVEGL